MKNNSELLIGLIIGAAAGAALTVFIHSEKGQQVIDDIQDAASKAEKDIKKAIDRFEDKLDKGKELAGEYTEKGKKFFNKHAN